MQFKFELVLDSLITFQSDCQYFIGYTLYIFVNKLHDLILVKPQSIIGISIIF